MAGWDGAGSDDDRLSDAELVGERESTRERDGDQASPTSNRPSTRGVLGSEGRCAWLRRPFRISACPPVARLIGTVCAVPVARVPPGSRPFTLLPAVDQAREPHFHEGGGARSIRERLLLLDRLRIAAVADLHAQGVLMVRLDPGPEQQPVGQ